MLGSIRKSTVFLLSFKLLLLLSFQSQATYFDAYHKPSKQVDYYLDFLLEGHTAFFFRGRFEYATDKSIQPFEMLSDHDSGRALTLSSRLNFTSANICNFWGGLEFNNVTSFATSRHNSGMLTTPDKIRFAEIPDPKGTSLNEVFLAYDGLYKTKLILGRQKIHLDNGRFVSSIDFRQTPQTFDAFIIENKYFVGLQLFYGYIARMNTIWQNNESALFGERSHNTHLLNGSYEFYPFGVFTGYLYYIQDKALRTISNKTYGFRYEGDIDLQRAHILLVGEYAYQSSNSTNPIDYNAEYYLVSGAFSHPLFLIGVGYEWFEGNDITPGKSFIAPLGDHHRFNGYSDRFRTTPNAGLTDLYFFATSNFWKVDVEAAYHRFHAEAQGIKYGDEVDLILNYAFLKHYKLNVGYANFSGKVQHGFGNSKRAWMSVTAEIG